MEIIVLYASDCNVLVYIVEEYLEFYFWISGNFRRCQSEVDTRLFGGVGKVDFRRTESLISRPRTGQKEENIEFQPGSVVCFGFLICEYHEFYKYRDFRCKYVYLSTADK